MSFISPWMLWALFAAAIPVLIHLVNRWRHKSMPWAAMDFILKVTRERRGRKKLLQYLILSARVLALAALVTAVARPLTGGFISWSGSGVQEVVLILDRSLSMGAQPGHTRSLQQAIPGLVADTLDKLDDTRLVLIDSVTQSPVSIDSPDSLPQLANTATTDTASDFPSLFSAAARYIAGTSSLKTEIWVATDMQASDWQKNSPRWKSVRTELFSLASLPSVRLLSLPQRPASNRSVKVDKAVAGQDEITIDFTVTREGDAALQEETLPLTISLNNSSIATDVTVSGSVTRLSRKLPLPPGSEEGFGYISIPHDAQPRDDCYYFVYQTARVSSTLVVSDRPDIAGVLQTMAAPPGMRGVSSEMASIERLPDLSPYSLVIWQGALLGGDHAARLTACLESGGSVLFLPDEREEPHNPEFAGATWLPVRNADSDQYYRITRWDHEHGPLHDSIGNKPLPLQGVQAIRRAELSGDAHGLAWWDDGSMAVARIPCGRGEACFLTALPDYTWSNLSEGHLLLPLIRRLADKGAKRFDAGISLTVGDQGLPVSSSSLPVRVDSYPSPADRVSSPRTSAGVYRLDSLLFCVNRPDGENDPEQVTGNDIRRLLPDIVIHDFTADESGSLVHEIWRFFLIACLLFLLAEALLSLPPASNNKPGQRHDPD